MPRTMTRRARRNETCGGRRWPRTGLSEFFFQAKDGIRDIGVTGVQTCALPILKKAEKNTATEKPPLLYDLTELQRNANARYGFTAERTLRAAQSLYEERKLITYPRTSSRYLSKDMVGGLKKRVDPAGALPSLTPFAEKLLGLPRLPINKRVVDDAKVTDHHAIVPTVKKLSGDLPPDEARVYDLVARRFLAVFFPPARFENTTVVTEVRGETFLSKGRVVLEAGWRALYPDGVGGKKEKEPPVLPEIEVGQGWAVAKVGVKEGETKPPPRYSEAALLGAMETAGKFVEDEELRQAMKESGRSEERRVGKECRSRWSP